MPIIFDQKNVIFNLQTPNTSYILGIYDGKIPMHIHYGKRLENTYDMFAMMDRPKQEDTTWNQICQDTTEGTALNLQLLELPTYGDGDYRPPALHAQYADGSTVSKLYYVCHSIYDGKSDLGDLPSSYVEGG